MILLTSSAESFGSQFGRIEYNPLINADTLISVSYNVTSSSVIFTMENREVLRWKYDDAELALFDFHRVRDILSKITDNMNVNLRFGDAHDDANSAQEMAFEDGIEQGASEVKEEKVGKSK